LLSNSRYVVAEESGHSIHMTQPEVIVDAARWVLDEFSGRSSRSAQGQEGNENAGKKSCTVRRELGESASAKSCL